MRCASCGHENRDEAKFCEECARALALACSHCGAALRATAKFCDACGTALARSQQPFDTPVLSPVEGHPEKKGSTRGDRPIAVLHEHEARTRSTTEEGERKTVTALFADIQGSMELLEELDPEEARALLDPALTLMMEAVHRYGGYVAQSTGDGIFALFGAPVAHEDHPQRALYAALRMQRS